MQLLGTRSYRHTVSSDDVESAREWSVTKPCSVPKEFTDLAEHVMSEDNISKPTNADEAIVLYKHLKSVLSFISLSCCITVIILILFFASYCKQPSHTLLMVGLRCCTEGRALATISCAISAWVISFPHACFLPNTSDKTKPKLQTSDARHVFPKKHSGEE